MLLPPYIETFRVVSSLAKETSLLLHRSKIDRSSFQISFRHENYYFRETNLIAFFIDSPVDVISQRQVTLTPLQFHRKLAAEILFTTPDIMVLTRNTIIVSASISAFAIRYRLNFSILENACRVNSTVLHGSPAKVIEIISNNKQL